MKGWRECINATKKRRIEERGRKKNKMKEGKRGVEEKDKRIE